MEPGIYVEKGSKNPRDALVITNVDSGYALWFDTSSLNTPDQIRPACTRIGTDLFENFEQRYEKATSKQLASVREELEVQRDTLNEKLAYLDNLG